MAADETDLPDRGEIDVVWVAQLGVVERSREIQKGGYSYSNWTGVKDIVVTIQSPLGKEGIRIQETRVRRVLVTSLNGLNKTVALVYEDKGVRGGNMMTATRFRECYISHVKDPRRYNNILNRSQKIVRTRLGM